MTRLTTFPPWLTPGRRPIRKSDDLTPRAEIEECRALLGQSSDGLMALWVEMGWDPERMRWRDCDAP